MGNNPSHCCRDEGSTFGCVHENECRSLFSPLHEFSEAEAPDEDVADVPDKLVKRSGHHHRDVGPYWVDTSQDGLLGKGSSCFCYRACLKQVHESARSAEKWNIAVKMYRDEVDSAAVRERFLRQVDMLQGFQDRFVKPKDNRLWHEVFKNEDLHTFFIKLLSYSPLGQKPMYVATEMGQYTLRDYLDLQKEQGISLPLDKLWSISKAILRAVGALHAKEFIHLDLKPENMMVFNGHIKLIDIDGARPAGTLCTRRDSMIVTPVYCAPELALLLASSRAENQRIKLSSTLDAWSVGMILCELVIFAPVLADVWMVTLESVGDENAGYSFLQWLSRISTLELPAALSSLHQEVYQEFCQFILGSLLLPTAERRTMAECLSLPQFSQVPNFRWECIPFGEVLERRTRMADRKIKTPSIQLINEVIEQQQKLSVERWEQVKPLPPPESSSRSHTSIEQQRRLSVERSQQVKTLPLPESSSHGHGLIEPGQMHMHTKGHAASNPQSDDLKTMTSRTL